MAPKPAPKLTKKQLAELAKQQAKKKQAEELQRCKVQQERLQQQRRLQLIQAKKKSEQQHVRIEEEKIKYSESMKLRVQQENRAYKELTSSAEWNKFTTQYFKDYDTLEPKLSTFISIFRDEPFVSPEKSISMCQESEIYVGNLFERMLNHRAEYQKEQEQDCKRAIDELRRIQMQKLEEIIIQLANSAQEIEQKNNQYNKAKGQPNRKTDGKIVQYKHFLSQNFKLGMFLNSTTTKNLNKFRPIQIKEFGLNTEIPSKWINANSIVKFQWTNFNPYQVSKTEPFMIVGGVYNLEFYELLLGSKKVNNFTVKKFFKGKQILDRHKLSSALVKQPFQVMYQIPKYIFLTPFDKSQIRIAQYDFSSEKWSLLPNDTIVEYEVPEKRVVCRVSRPEPIAYVQNRCEDFPYIAWELRTVEKGLVYLDIELKRYFSASNSQQDKRRRIIVRFQITPNAVKLVLDKIYPELQDLCTNLHTPEALFHQLSIRGIHLLPTDDDYDLCGIPRKNQDAQKSAIRDISYAVQSFYIRSQPNNGNQIGVKIRQNLEYENVFLEDQEKDWKKIRWDGGDRCGVVDRGVDQRHLNLEVFVKIMQVLLENHQFTQAECLERIKYDRDFLLRKTVMKVMKMTRILSFIAAEAQESSLIEILKGKVIVN